MAGWPCFLPLVKPFRWYRLWPVIRLRLLPFCHALFARYLAAVSFGRGFYASQLVMGNLGRLRACGGIVVFALSFGAVWGGVMGVITAPVYCYWGGMGKSCPKIDKIYKLAGEL